MHTKAQIRQEFIDIRKGLTEKERQKKSIKVLKKLENFSLFKKARHVLFYYTHGPEVDSVPLIKKIIKKKKLYLPVIHAPNQFKAVPLKDFSVLERGGEGVPEPMDTFPQKSHEHLIELIIVPGVAFTPNGVRLGMGKGYYDRYLKKHTNTPKIALAFEKQMLDSLPKEPYDEPVDVIITDQNIYYCL